MSSDTCWCCLCGIWNALCWFSQLCGCHMSTQAFNSLANTSLPTVYSDILNEHVFNKAMSSVKTRRYEHSPFICGYTQFYRCNVKASLNFNIVVGISIHSKKDCNISMTVWGTLSHKLQSLHVCEHCCFFNPLLIHSCWVLGHISM